MDEIVGKITGILFSNRGTGYHILKIRPDGNAGHSVVKGTFSGPSISVGLKAKFLGRWENHPTYGKELSASSIEIIPEMGRNGIVTYLVNHVKSVGPVTAGKLYAEFGDDLIRVLEREPDKLRSCGLLTEKQVDAITEEWLTVSEQRTTAVFLGGLGLNSAQIRSAYSRFRTECVSLVQENPYCLYECSGIGFHTADQAAKKLGVDRDDPRRVDAVVLYTIRDLCSSDGHMYVTSPQIKGHAQRLLGRGGVDPFSHGEYLSDAHYYRSMERLSEDEEVVQDEDRIYPIHSWQYETESARALAEMIRLGPRPLGDLKSTLADYESRNGIELSDQQREAFLLLNRSRVCVVSGFPGTGKTTMISSFVDLFERNGLHYVLMSPTGIAAKRLSQVTGKPASTIHRALGYKQDGGWGFHSSNKFHADAVIVDETSMVDGATFYHLISALPPDTILVLVGDRAQLPSVGAGYVLNDLMSCADVPHVSLTRIYRQSGTSDIVTVAHQVLVGQNVDTTHRADSQVLFFPYDRESALREVCKLTLLMKEKGSNFQVIAPKYDGDLGVNNLNKRLREVLNPDFASGRASKLKHGSCDLYEGDRVMIVKNDYDRMVFNGDVGKIQRISMKDDVVEVRVFDWFDNDSTVPRYVDKVFTFKVEEARSMLNVAYACTTHKVQGQEFDYVILPMTMQYGIMLYRNLIYTAITRAKKKVFLFGDPNAFSFAVSNERETVRNSGLGARVSSEISSAPASPLPQAS